MTVTSRSARKTISQERQRRRAERRNKPSGPKAIAKGKGGSMRHRVPVIELSEREQQLGRLYARRLP
jgi:hypothetical protein